MSMSSCIVQWVVFCSAATAACVCVAAEDTIVWTDAKQLTVEGQAWTDTATPYHRFPARAEGVVPPRVWGLGHNSAGIAVRFVSDAPSIHAKWTLRSENLDMPHMPATGVSGLDLYVRLSDGTWHWLANGRPNRVSNQQCLAEGIPEGGHEYMLYLPLYNDPAALEIGVPEGTRLERGPERPERKAKPIVFWGTSILQGGCASRPGMAYPSIIGRRMDWHTMNFGFSGNGRMDPPVTELLAGIDAAAYVIDCCPNMQPGEVSERTAPLVRTLRKARPKAPIVLVENVQYQEGAFLPASRAAYVNKNKALRTEYDKLRAEAITDLHYIPCDDLFGHDGEATVDGTHATDLGFLRIADAIQPVLEDILGK